MLVVMGTIFYLSHQPGTNLYLPPIIGIDKIMHIFAYGVLAATVIYVIPKSIKKKNPYKVLFLTVSFCLVYGISDEFHQYFIPGRFVSGADVIADVLGAMLVSIVWLKLRRK